MEIITVISDVLIPECIMLCKATQRMLDLKLAYCCSKHTGGRPPKNVVFP